MVGFADVGGLTPPTLSCWPRGVSIALALDPESMKGLGDGPTADYYREYERVNRALNEIAGRTAEAIFALGCRAEPFPATIRGHAQGGEFEQTLRVEFPHKTAATRAGLGWVGKSALLVTPRFGPRVRLATVFTDLPLQVGAPLTAGACGDCKACSRACPAGAIKGNEWRTGLRREEMVDVRACWETARRLLRERVGANDVVCGVCVAVCPVGRRQHAGEEERSDSVP